MIISRERGFIFVHAPKTGGTALAMALEEGAPASDLLIGDTPEALRRRHLQWPRIRDAGAAGRVWKHSTLADVEGLISRDDMARLLTFTLVRNPWDMLVSYYHWLQLQSFAHPAVGLSKALSFSDFIAHPMIAGSFRDAPAASYMRDGAGAEHCDLYIRLEHFAQDSQLLEAHLGRPLRMPRANASPRDRDWRVYYSDADAALVADICAQDIARFGYRFDDVTA